VGAKEFVHDATDLQRETRRRLPRIRQPILVVQGRRDQTIDPRSGEVILRETALTDKELRWLTKRPGHLAWLKVAVVWYHIVLA
jgi:esterase/lipase